MLKRNLIRLWGLEGGILRKVGEWGVLWRVLEFSGGAECAW